MWQRMVTASESFICISQHPRALLGGAILFALRSSCFEPTSAFATVPWSVGGLVIGFSERWRIVVATRATIPPVASRSPCRSPSHAERSTVKNRYRSCRPWGATILSIVLLVANQFAMPIAWAEAASRTFDSPFDANGDGLVDGADFAPLLANWGPNPGAGDFDGDCVVGSSDLGRLLAAWGPVVGAAGTDEQR